MINLDLKNKVAIVTGASSGIGKAAALALLKYGATVIGVSATDNIYNLSNPYPCGKLVPLKGDVSKERDVAKVVKYVLKNFSKIDILFNNAGVVLHGPITKTDERDWERIINTNLKGQFLFIKHVIPDMAKRKHGYIINMASMRPFKPLPHMSVYTASKAGIIGLTAALNADYKNSGIKIFCLCPSAVDTKMKLARLSYLKSRGLIAYDMKVRQPEEIAEMILKIASGQFDNIGNPIIKID